MTSNLLPTSRFVNASRPAAVLWLAGTLALMIWGLFVSSTARAWALGMAGTDDLEFYRRVADRVRSGSTYYDAFDRSADEMGFGVGTLFHCRLPTYTWLLYPLPHLDWYFWAMLALSLVAAVLSVVALVKPWAGTTGQVAALVLMIGGAFSWTVYEPDAFLTTEPWCEALLLLSLCAYARGRWPLGMTASLAALSLRELVLPWCVVGWAVALWNRRWREGLLWTASMLGFFTLLYLHGVEVGRRHPAAAEPAVGDWTRTYGLAFVLRASVMNVFLRPLPVEISALLLPLALLGLAGWPGEIGRRMFMTATAYAVAFLYMQGGEYWGYLYTPLIVLGLVRAPVSVRDLWQAAHSRR